MSTSKKLKVRYSVEYLEEQYHQGNKQPLEDLVRAWKGIKELPATDKRSFFVLGGYHGEPFQYRQQVDQLSSVDTYTYWGGYCNHGNVLFPTWHRVYVLKLEEALQSIVPGVTMPYWDETSEYSLKNGIPSILTQEKFELDGKIIDNPLRSFVLPEALSDYVPTDDRIYEKPQGYETVRYPLSGLVGTPEAQSATKEHNATYPDFNKNVKLLNENIVAWLKGPTPESHPSDGIYSQFQNCLRAPNYTVFSNTTSAAEWNKNHHGVVTPLESPHNDIHLAVGGFDVPGQGEGGIIHGANGDMGENNTAAMDPIFFFHHCNIDRMFWLWQKQNGHTDKIDIIDGYQGTSSSDSQGPTPGVAPGTSLTLDTLLNPFLKDEFATVYTSRDCINIEKQLGYTYAPGSLEEVPHLMGTRSNFSSQKLVASKIDRALFQGSFVVEAYAIVKNAKGESTKHYIGHHSVLSRWNVIKCANCLTHLEVIAHFPLSAIPKEAVGNGEYHLEFKHRELAEYHLESQHRRLQFQSSGVKLPAKLSYQLDVKD
ncbi:tyrosinase family protein [Nostoc sp. C117]|uniref:tyrosinase family protein n=1 Tax=Nostoc sp. C117 TaxID=3349875 RepID=UPI00370DA93E